MVLGALMSLTGTPSLSSTISQVCHLNTRWGAARWHFATVILWPFSIPRRHELAQLVLLYMPDPCQLPLLPLHDIVLSFSSSGSAKQLVSSALRRASFMFDNWR
jgi:hypothetical protein